MTVLRLVGVPPTAPRIVRVPDGEWRALDGDQSVGRARAVQRPDRRWFVALDSQRADAYEALLHAIAEDLQQDLYMTVDESDHELLQRCRQLGCTVNRREDEYLVPTDADVTGLTDAALPAGLGHVSAAEADEDQLRALDEVLREDVPGANGWVNDPRDFREYTFDARHFDPMTYLVAVDEATGGYAGLVRVWNDPGNPRLGLIGVVAAHRRRGVARALLAAAFRALHDRGFGQVAAEVDVTNAASTELLRRLGARRTGGSVELIRGWRPA